MINEPDGFLGAVVASESLGMTDTLIDGAGGCRSRSQIMMHDLIQEYSPEDGSVLGSKFFSRQSRLPCTYLNGEDFIFGTGPKVSAGAESVSRVTGRRVLLVDTLGASLLCTDYSGLTDGDVPEPVIMDGDLSGMSFCEGYDLAMSSVLSKIDMDEGDSGSVNLLGYSIADPGWEAGAEDLRRLLGLMGVRVGCIPGCMPTGAEVSSMGRASLNVMVRPELCRRTAEMLRDRTGTPFLMLSEGAPIGYRAVASFVREVADTLDADPQPALDHIRAEERRVHSVLMNFDRGPIGLHAKGLAIDAESSTVLPLLKWMVGTFAMVPRHVVMRDDAYAEEVRSYLDSIGFSDSLDGTGGDVEVTFCDGLSALEGRLRNVPESFVEVRMPRGRYMDLMGRCVVGTRGCRYILDEMFNGISRFRCGQPTEVDYRPEGGRKGCCRR